MNLYHECTNSNKSLNNKSIPFFHFESLHFSEAEKTAITTALQTLQTSLPEKLASLTAEERQQYGSIVKCFYIFKHRVFVMLLHHF
ncbi:hypothetical protein EG348_13925 [Chryseobacterium sp. G0201]|nr:hypothetical protein EG348_13925 [Chryseobacterium sp. G0201]